jgi:hypothetical protein
MSKPVFKLHKRSGNSCHGAIDFWKPGNRERMNPKGYWPLFHTKSILLYSMMSARIG